MEFHMINITYAALHMRAQTEKTTFSCKDGCTLTKHTRRWTYSDLRYFWFRYQFFKFKCRGMYLWTLVPYIKDMILVWKQERPSYWHNFSLNLFIFFCYLSLITEKRDKVIPKSFFLLKLCLYAWKVYGNEKMCIRPDAGKVY